MYNIIKNINENAYFILFISICSIAGFLLSIYLTVKSHNIAKILEKMSMAKDYNKKRIFYIDRLKGFKTSILEDNIRTSTILHNISEDIYSFETLYKPLLTKRDTFEIWKLKFYLRKKPAKIDFDRVCFELDYLIGRFHKKED